MAQRTHPMRRRWFDLPDGTSAWRPLRVDNLLPAGRKKHNRFHYGLRVSSKPGGKRAQRKPRDSKVTKAKELYSPPGTEERWWTILTRVEQLRAQEEGSALASYLEGLARRDRAETERKRWVADLARVETKLVSVWAEKARLTTRAAELRAEVERLAAAPVEEVPAWKIRNAQNKADRFVKRRAETLRRSATGETSQRQQQTRAETASVVQKAAPPAASKPVQSRDLSKVPTATLNRFLRLSGRPDMPDTDFTTLRKRVKSQADHNRSNNVKFDRDEDKRLKRLGDAEFDQFPELS